MTIGRSITGVTFSGHHSQHRTEFQGTVKTTNLKELIIPVNYFVRYIDHFDVILEIVDDKGKIILTKQFKVGTGMAIDKKELGL